MSKYITEEIPVFNKFQWETPHFRLEINCFGALVAL